MESSDNNLKLNKEYSLDVYKLSRRDIFTDIEKINMKSLEIGDIVYISVTSPTIINDSNISDINVIRIDHTYQYKQ